MLRKGIYPYKHMDNWKKINKTLSPLTEQFYIHLNMQNITDPDYVHTKRACKDIQIKNPGEYHDLHVQSNTLLLADVFENFYVFSAPELAWQVALKKD